MKDYSEIERKYELLKEENLLLKRVLSMHREKIDSLLLMTESVNKNFNASAIISLFENSLNSLIKAGSYAFLIKDKNWSLVLNKGITLDLNEINLEKDLSHIYKTQSAKNLKNEKLRGFTHVIPVLHKNEHLAYLFLTDIDFDCIDCSEEEKLRFIETLLNLTIISLENKKLFLKTRTNAKQEDLILAAEVQAELIPSVFPNNKHFEFYGKYIPYDTVGGDYYDFIQLDEENIAFCICDVAGKGISAGMLMSNFQASLRTLLSRNYNLKDLVIAINEKFINVTKQNRYITMFIATFNIKSKKLEYINAGHNPPILKNGNKIIQLSKGCTILGMIEELIGLESEEIILEKDALLLMYTDGLSEIENEQKEEFGTKNLEKYIEINHTLPLNTFTENLILQIEDYKGENDIFDDVSLLCAKF